jgi:hypothetical protein
MKFHYNEYNFVTRTISLYWHFTVLKNLAVNFKGTKCVTLGFSEGKKITQFWKKFYVCKFNYLPEKFLKIPSTQKLLILGTGNCK